MKAVIAKFVVESKREAFEGEGQAPSFDIGLRAVTEKDENPEENAAFTRWTPAGSIQMHVTNPAAAEFFSQGKQVMVTFTE